MKARQAGEAVGHRAKAGVRGGQGPPPRLNAYGGIGMVRELGRSFGEINRARSDAILKRCRYYESDVAEHRAFRHGTRTGGPGACANNADETTPGGEGDPEPDGGGRIGDQLQEAFDSGSAAVWRGRGRDLLAPVAYVDVADPGPT